MPAFSPWAASGLLGGAGPRIAVAAAASAVLWLAVLWSSLGVAPPASQTASSTGGVSAPARIATPPLRALAASGAPAPGGGNYDRFGLEMQNPVAPVNVHGDVAFFAKLMRSATEEALFLTHQGRASLVASVGSAVPGGGTITSFTEHPAPSLNDVGSIAFAATIEGGRASEAVFAWSGGKLTSVAQSGAKAPGINGGAFFDFGPPVVNNSGDVAFLATVRRGREALDAIYLASKGQAAKIAAAGDAAPGGGKLAALGTPALNAKGVLAFAAVVEGGETPGAIFVGSAAGLRRVVGAGDPAPGGGMFTRLSEHLGLDDAGRVAFGAFLGQGAPRSGMFVAGETVAPLVMLGAAAPGGGTFASFGDAPALAGDGRLAFVAAVEGGPGTTGIYASGPGGLARVAGVGDPVADGKRIGYFPLNTMVAAGPGGRVTFQAGLQAGDKQSTDSPNGDELADAILVFAPEAR